MPIENLVDTACVRLCRTQARITFRKVLEVPQKGDAGDSRCLTCCDTGTRSTKVTSTEVDNEDLTMFQAGRRGSLGSDQDTPSGDMQSNTTK